MSHAFRDDDVFSSDEAAPTETALFAALIRGESIPPIVNPDARTRAKREELERLAQFSSWHAEELSRIRNAEAEARRERESLQWAARISTRAEEKLRALQQREAEERAAWRRAEEFYERYVANVSEWNPGQPRVSAGSPQGGQWSKGRGDGSSGGGTGGLGDASIRSATYSGPKRVAAQQVSARSVGHHWNPVSAVTDESIRPLLSDDAVAYAAGSYSGATDPSHLGGTYGNVSHPKYNQAVKEELKTFLKANNVTEMTKEQMAKFIGLVENGLDAQGKPHPVIGPFNRAVKSMVPKGSTAPTKMDDILAAGRKYMKTSRFRLLAAAAVLSGVLSDAVAAQVQSLDVMSDSGHYKQAIKALQDGDLDRAHRMLTGDSNSLYTEIMKKVNPLAALRFKKKMDEEFDRAKTREYK